MFENRVKRPNKRSVTSKSTSRQKLQKKELLEVVLTDPSNLKTQKSKSQCLPREKNESRKSISGKKIIKNFINNVEGVKKRQDFVLNCPSDKRIKKPVIYENLPTEKVACVKWGGKAKQSLSRKKNTKSIQKQKKQWDQSNIPYSDEHVLFEYSHYLTKYEQTQIKQFKKVYYIGHKAKKRQRIDNFNSESQFDNEEKQYKYILNDHIAYRYQILQVIGKGSYGQVFQVYDHKNKVQLALKIIKNRQKFSKQAFIQIKLLTKIKQKDLGDNCDVIKIQDFVVFRNHVCILFELLSQNLYELIIRNNYNGLEMQLIRKFAIQILQALKFLKEQKIIHCDLKPQNILLKEYHKSGIKIIDFGSACMQNETIYTYIQSRYYRAPQITLGMKYDSKIDIWSVGCILGQLYTGVPLFPGENQNQQMKYLTNTIGLPSEHLLNQCSRSHLFFSCGALKQNISELKTIDYFSKKLAQRIPDQDFRSFVQLFLKWDPKERITPSQALQHKWIVDGIPQVRKPHLHTHNNNSNAHRDEEKSVGNRTVRIVKSKSKDKKARTSQNANTRKYLPVKH